MQLGIYRHYKGKNYRVIGKALHRETEEELVLYEPLYESKSEYNFFVRPLSMFFEEIEIGGKKQKRFEYIGDKNYNTL